MVGMEKAKTQLEHDGRLVISTGASRKETRWQLLDTAWSDLAGRLRNTQRTSETVAEYAKMAKSVQDDIKDVGGFVGGVLAGEKRRQDAIKWRQLVTLDADFAPATFWDIVREKLDCACLVYSTHKHSPEKPRLRLLVPLSRPAMPEEYVAIARRIAGDIGIDYFDDTTYEPHRLMYWPSTPQDGEYVFEVQDRPWLAVDATLARYDDWREPRLWPESSRAQQKRQKLADKQGDPTEKPGVVGAFCRTYAVSEAIDTFLADTYTKESEQRYSYAQGSTSGGLVLYDNDLFAFSHHGTDPAGGKLSNAFDLVRIHKFGPRDEDAPEGTPINRLPSYTAMCDFALQDPTVKQACAEMQLADAREAFEEDLSWTIGLKMTSTGKILSSTDNIRLILENAEAFKDKLALNEFRECMVALAPMPWDEGGRDNDIWIDEDDAGLRWHLETVYGITGVRKVSDAVSVVMNKHRVHPVRDYLNALAWDGQQRADTLFIKYLGAEDCPYSRAVSRKALVGAVARILRPGCKHDHMLVLVGAQGTFKSSIVAKLGMGWFSDSLYTMQGKEAYEQLPGTWIVEIGEMAATRKADVENVKQFISKQTDKYRAAYARRATEHKRQCAFFGTTNDIEFLHDQTGGRRFWPVVVDRQERTKNLWKDFTQEEIDQVWAEAVHLYREGETWHLDSEMEEVARQVQEQHSESSVLVGLIQDYLEIPLPTRWPYMDIHERRVYLKDEKQQEELGEMKRDKVCALEIWVELLEGETSKLDKMKAREIKFVLRNIDGWEEYEGKSRFVKPYGLQRSFVRQ